MAVIPRARKIATMIAKRILPVLLVMGGAWGVPIPAAAQGPEIKLDITARCEGGDAQFEIVNKGERWAGMAMVSIVRTDNGAVITQREMRMATGQRMVFRAREAPDNIGVGLRIEPDWYKRPPALDSIITCLTSPTPEGAQPSAPAQPPAGVPPSPPR